MQLASYRLSLQLLRPEFAHLLSKDQEAEIFDLIGRLIQTLSSPDIAIDDRHTPRLYARFLAGLLMRHRREGGAAGRTHHSPPKPQNPTLVQGTTSMGTGTGRSSASSTSSGARGSQSTYTQGPRGDDAAGGGYRQAVFDKNNLEQVYPSEPPNPLNTIDFGGLLGNDGSAFNFGFEALNSYAADEDMLATIQTLKSPTFWQNMMVPG
jgi:hypothetical protein